MKLIGSPMSPYVRRLRLWLAGVDYEFRSLDIYSPEGREELRRHTPVMKIPVLVDGGQTLYDSRVIQRYLNEKLQRESLGWEDENSLTLIDAANDSFVALLLLQRSGLDIEQDLMFLKLQKERIGQTMQLLDEMVEQGRFAQWNYPAICLFCLLDWIEFRGLFDFADHGALQAFRERQLTQEAVSATDPRQAG